ncbi:MAG TPA: aminodeoxychorismate synthase component I [Solirubrobacteraceae bacterium]|nr:aminodeoxychorismate synthase component I [Solirubrobacteraceae bacterium]
MLLREPLDADVLPALAALILRGEDRPFALLGAWAGGGAVLGSEPVRAAVGNEDLFALLDQVPEVARAGVPPWPPAVGGGWFGFLGFEARHRVERGHPPPPRPVPLGADGALAYYDHVLRMDARGRWWFEALVTPGREDAIARRRDALAARLAETPAPRPFEARDWRWVPSPAGHAEAVEACRTRIAAGDLFQANLCMRLEGRLEGDAFDLFAAAVQALPTDRAAFVAGPWGTVASLSPELFLRRCGRTVRSEPIKGTRPAGRREELARSEKDRAENVMIVDLVRNDLGRVCEPGTVRATALAEVRPHAGVWHMVSEVEGELRDRVGDAGLLCATFPPGSVTGAPKLAALDVIAELESTGREAYTGAIGFASPLAGLELSVAIRTFEVRGRRIWFGAGGGIVADSDGREEAREAAAKAAPLLAAIGAEPPRADDDVPPGEHAGGPQRDHAGDPRRAAVPRPLRVVRRGPRPVPRPDPAAGLYETILVARGRPQDLAAHLDRLAASARALYGRAPPAELAERAAAAAHGHERARLRIDFVPGEDATVLVTPLGAIAPARLRPVVLPGGLGPHKWRDRTLLEAHEADDPATMPLLLDADGLVLEASRASIVVRARDGLLYTPPDDGRILPGITARRSGARPRALALADVEQADAVYVASALRGLSPAVGTPAA